MVMTPGMLPMMYRLDWYWRVGDDDSKVFSSKRADLIWVDDEEYKVWCENHAEPTSITSFSELQELLIRVGEPEDGALVTKLLELSPAQTKEPEAHADA